MSPEFDGVGGILLKYFLINNDIIIDLIKKTDQTEANNIKLVPKITGGNEE